MLEHDPRCGRCGLDVLALAQRRHAAIIAYTNATYALLYLGLRIPESWIERGRPWRPVTDALRALGFDRPLGSLAELDHTVPLSQGGGDHGLNYTVLCQPCHRVKTAEDAGRRARKDRRSKRAWKCALCSARNYPWRASCFSCGRGR
jgi:hypothetical protein